MPTTRVNAPITARHAREAVQSTETRASRAAEQPSSRADARAHAHRRAATAPPRAAHHRRNARRDARDITQSTQRNTTRHIAPPDEFRPSCPRAAPRCLARRTERRHGEDARGASDAAPARKAGGSSSARTREGRREETTHGTARARGKSEAARTRATSPWERAGSPRAESPHTLRVDRPCARERPPIARVASDAVPARGGRGGSLHRAERKEGRTRTRGERFTRHAAGACSAATARATRPRPTRACARAARSPPVAMRAGEGSLRTDRQHTTTMVDWRVSKTRTLT